MTTLRALIVDDEAISRDLLRRMLEAEPDFEVVGACGSGAAALAALERNPIDVVFLDIEMPDMSGFEVLDRIEASRRPQIVFATAFDEFAVKAFEVHAIDYLLKPFDDERLRETLGRVRSHADGAGARKMAGRLGRLLSELGNHRTERIAVRHGRDTALVRLGDVDWMESESNYVRFHVGPKSYLARARLGDMEERLDPARFVRIHRRTIVNVDRIESLSPWARGDLRVTLSGGHRLNVSRRFKCRLERVMTRLTI